MTEVTLTLASEVRRLREQSGMSQERLAEKLGVSREAVSAIERGKTTRPSDEVLLGLELYLGLGRQRAHELMGAVPRESDEDIAALIYRMGAFEDPQDRLRAYRQLPEQLQRSLRRVMADLFLEESRALQAIDE